MQILLEFMWFNHWHIFVLAVKVYSCLEYIINYVSECKSEKLVYVTEPGDEVDLWDESVNFFFYVEEDFKYVIT
jgi:hypothetical protein